jgi:hypothetical protein
MDKNPALTQRSKSTGRRSLELLGATLGFPSVAVLLYQLVGSRPTVPATRLEVLMIALGVVIAAYFLKLSIKNLIETLRDRNPPVADKNPRPPS